MRSTLLVAFSVLASFTGLLHGQAPKGKVVVAAFNPGPWNPRQGMTGGLFVVHPRNPGMATPVQGLPLELTGTGIVSQYETGLGSVLALPDGDLLVGEETPPPNTVSGVDADFEIHRVRLSWDPVQGIWNGQVVRSYLIGKVRQGAPAAEEVSDMELLPNGEVLLSIWGATTALNLLQAPMSGVKLATLNLVSGSVNPVPLSGFPANSTLNTLAVSPDGATAYLGEVVSPTNLGNVWSLPLPGGGVATPLTNSSTMGPVTAIDRDNQDNLVVGTLGAMGVVGAAPNLHLVAPGTGVITDLLPGISGVRNAVLVERNTDDFFTTRGSGVVHVSGGTQTVLASGSMAPWGLLSGFAMLPAVDSFGSPSGGTSSYEWKTTPNPGGLPLAGNTGFSITCGAPRAQSASLIAVSTARTNAPIPLAPGGTLLLAPGTVIGTWFLIPSPATITLPLPIPNDPSFAGFSLFGQTFHLNGGGVVSSPGLCLTVL